MVDQYYKKPVNTSAIKQAYWRCTPLSKFGFELSSDSEPVEEKKTEVYKMANTGKFEDRFTELGAIWKQKDGATLSFKLKDGVSLKSGDNIVAFSNKFKKEDKHPDYNLYLDKQPKAAK